MERISFEDFQKLDLRIGKILKCEKVPKTMKLLRLEVDIGDEIRQIVAGMAEFFSPEELVDKLVVVVTNLEPRKIRGLVSDGMILAADLAGKPYFLTVEEYIPPGSKVW